MGNELDRPLGGKPRRRKQPVPRRFGRRLAALAATALFIGLAGYTALSPEPLRQAASDIPVELPEAEPTAEEPAPQSVADNEPQTAEDTPFRDGRSGADIHQELTGTTTVTTFRPGLRDEEGPLVLQSEAPGQDPRMAHLPERHLLEDSPFGPLPIRGPDGERPVDAYARPWSGARGARIAIVVGGLGLSQTGTQYAIEELPGEITLAFAATGNSLTRWMQEARRGGHEIVLQVPMEPYGYPSVDPGPGTLTVDAGAEANMERLHQAMAEITNYTGIMNYLGGRFLADADAMEPVMRDLAGRGLLFLDDGTSARSLADTLAGTIGVPFAAADSVIDAERARGAILENLDALERTATRNGTAIGVASAFEVSVDAIADWAREAAARNIEIVAVSALTDDPERR